MAEGISRRTALRMLFMTTTAFALPPGLLAREFGRGEGVPWEAGTGEVPYFGTNDQSFLTSEELSAVRAIAARLIPSDEDGPGATEADVANFIDRQLGGFYGRAQNWYMKGPFEEGLPTQGWQSEHPPARLYRLALSELDAYCETNHGGVFSALSETQQDEILKGLENEDITFDSVSAKTFFDLILENTIEGFFADPIYGGNRDMVAWRYVGFPGTRYDYRDFVGHNGARVDLPPVSLLGRPGWSGQ